MLKSLDHPNIVKFVENFEIAGESTIYFYTVTEMLKGGELFDRIVKKVAPPLEVIDRIVCVIQL